MTTSPVASVTDELIAELDKASTFTNWLMVEVQPGSLALLLAERAELKRDAGRYRWIKECDPEEIDIVIDNPGDDLDAAIDAAMQSEAKP